MCFCFLIRKGRWRRIPRIFIRKLLKASGVPMVQDRIPLIIGVRSFKAHWVIKVGVNSTNHEGNTPLMYAAEGGYDSCVQVLLRAGADVHKFAADAWTRQRFGTSSASAKDGGWTALIASAASGHAEAARLLLNAAADPNMSGSFGATPLMFAALGKHTSVVELLCDARAHVGQQSLNGKTALEYACDVGHELTIAVLRGR